jgi:hypothetical protein
MRLVFSRRLLVIILVSVLTLVTGGYALYVLSNQDSVTDRSKAANDTLLSKPIDTVAPVYYEFLVKTGVEESFIIKVESKSLIDSLNADLVNPYEERKLMIKGKLISGNGGYNTQKGTSAWNWSLEPSSLELTNQLTPECDAKPSFVRDNIEQYIKQGTGVYCPSSARVSASFDAIPYTSVTPTPTTICLLPEGCTKPTPTNLLPTPTIITTVTPKPSITLTPTPKPSITPSPSPTITPVPLVECNVLKIARNGTTITSGSTIAANDKLNVQLGLSNTNTKAELGYEISSFPLNTTDIQPKLEKTATVLAAFHSFSYTVPKYTTSTMIQIKGFAKLDNKNIYSNKCVAYYIVK